MIINVNKYTEMSLKRTSNKKNVFEAFPKLQFLEEVHLFETLI
jgi:hypothetical protein